jgi:hypothetical protein
MNLGFWKPETGSLANSASPAEVARAKSNQQILISSWRLRGYMGGTLNLITRALTSSYLAPQDEEGNQQVSNLEEGVSVLA